MADFLPLDGILKGKDPVTGNKVQLTAVADDDGNYVLRVADAAPFAYDEPNDMLKVTQPIHSKVTVETVINAQSVAAGATANVTFESLGADEIWFLFNTSQAPWTATASMGPWTALDNILPTTLFPQRTSFTTAFPTLSSPCKSLYIMAVPSSDATAFPTNTFDAAYKLRACHGGKLFITNNHATLASIFTVRIMRIWRG